MSELHLADRQKEYEKSYDTKITRRLPIIIRVDGKGFSRLTKHLTKPYSPDFLGIMAKTMLHSITEIQGACFGYQQSDEITFVLRNDQTFETEPWFGNRIQKMASIASSQTTLVLNKLLIESELDLPLTGDAMFDARVFALPSISEVINNVLWRQQDCMRNAVTAAAQAELSKKFGKKTALKALHGMHTTDKIELLRKECQIEFSDYPDSFKRGVAAYKIPMMFSSPEGSFTRAKWHLDFSIPDLNGNDERSWLHHILTNGMDIFRPDRDLIISTTD